MYFCGYYYQTFQSAIITKVDLDDNQIYSEAFSKTLISNGYFVVDANPIPGFSSFMIDYSETYIYFLANEHPFDAQLYKTHTTNGTLAK